MAEESKCVMCLTGKHPQWGEVEPAKMIDIRGEKRMRHEHTRDHMFTSLCVSEPAPDPQEPPSHIEQMREMFKASGIADPMCDLTPDFSLDEDQIRRPRKGGNQ